MANNKIENELIDYIQTLNNSAQNDWNNRFKIDKYTYKGNKRRLLVTFTMKDYTLNQEWTVCEDFYMLGKKYMGFKIWEKFNHFVNVMLEQEKENNNG